MRKEGRREEIGMTEGRKKGNRNGREGGNRNDRGEGMK